jgi:hypothetical protein
MALGCNYRPILEPTVIFSSDLISNRRNENRELEISVIAGLQERKSTVLEIEIRRLDIVRR